MHTSVERDDIHAILVNIVNMKFTKGPDEAENITPAW